MQKFAKYLAPLGVIATAAVIALPGSAGAKAHSTAHAAAKKIAIGYMNEIDGVPFVQIVKNSVLAAAQKAGVTVDVCNPNGDAQAAVNCAAQFKTEGVQGILNFQANAAAAPRVCAAGPKVPVIAFDIVQKPCQTMFYGANNAYAGQLSGTALGQFAKKKFGCKIDAFMVMDDPAVGVVNNERMNGMIDGYKSVCGKPNNLLYVNGGGATDTAIQPATDTLTRLTGDHKILVVSLNDDMAIGAIKAAQSSNRLGDIWVARPGCRPDVVAVHLRQGAVQELGGRHRLLPGAVRHPYRPAAARPDQGQGARDGVHEPQGRDPGNLRSVYPKACS